MKKYWDETITFDEYLRIAEQRVHHPATDADREFKPYYELGLQRMERALKTFNTDEQQANVLKNKNFDGKILIISEAWCGDASATVPALVRFFEPDNEVRIFLRDNDVSLIDQFQTNGTQSIPKVLVLNHDFTLRATWGPRPAAGNEMLRKYKENPESYTQEEFYNDLQVYYAKNKGRDAIDEILNLI